MAVMTVELSVTQRRAEALRAVSEGRVTYNSRSAQYLTDGVVASGWSWRTLSEMRTVGWIRILGSGTSATVELTKQGEEILAEL